MISLGDAILKIGGDISPLKNALDKGASVLNEKITGAATIAGASITAMGASIIATFASVTNAAMDYAGSMVDISERTGVATDKLQELKFAAEQSGGSVEGLESGLRKMSLAINGANEETQSYLQKGMEEQRKATEKLTTEGDKLSKEYEKQVQKLAQMQSSGRASTDQIIEQKEKIAELRQEHSELSSEYEKAVNSQRSVSEATGANVQALNQLGLTVDQLRTKTPDEQFILIAQAISQVGDRSQQTALAMQIFGKGGADLLPMLRSGAVGIEELAQKARDLGLIVSNESLLAAESFGDEWESVKSQLQMVVVELGNALIPTLKEMMPWIQDTVKSIIDWIRENDELIAKVGMVVIAIGAIASVVGPIILAIAGLGAVFAGISTVIAGFGAVMGLLSAPVLIVIAVIVALAAAGWYLYNNWDEVKSNIGAVWDWIKEKGKMIWDKILELLSWVWDKIYEKYFGWYETLKWVADKVVTVFNFVWDKIKAVWDGISKAFTTAISYIQGAWNTFLNIINGGLGVIQKAISWLGQLASFFGGTLNITGDLPGNASGTDYWRGGLTWVGEEGPEIVNLPRGSQILSSSDSMKAMGSGGSSQNITNNITVNASPGMNAKQVADEVFTRINRGMKLTGS